MGPVDVAPCLTPDEADAAVQAAGVRAHSRARRAAALALVDGGARLIHDAGRQAGLRWDQPPETWPADPWRDTEEAARLSADLRKALAALHAISASLRASLADEVP